MLDILKEVEFNLSNLLTKAISEGTLKTKYINYHHPYVSRIYFPFGQYRVSLHKIAPCSSRKDALYHPHPWESAVKIVKGSYEMGIGHSSSNLQPQSTDCRLILAPGSSYEMLDPDAWHYVYSEKDFVYTIMVSGKPTGRIMPIEPKQDFRELTQEEIDEIVLNILK